MKRDRWEPIWAMRRAENAYRTNGVPPGDGWDRGTHFARFEALGRLHMAIYVYRATKRVSRPWEMKRMLEEIWNARNAVKRAACPLLPA